MKSKKQKLLGLEPRTFTKAVQWQVDQDYINEMKMWAASESSVAESFRSHLSYLSKFLEEYYNNGVRKGDKNALHNTDELRKSTYHRQDCVRRDIYSLADAVANLDYESDLRPDEEGESESAMDAVDPNAIFDGSNYLITEKPKKTEPQPLKQFTKEEIETFAASRGLGVSKKGGSNE